MPQIRIEINDSGARAMLQRVAELGGDTRPLTEAWSGDMLFEVQQNFEEEGRPEKWAPLAEATKRARAKKGYWPGKILQQRGDLYRSVIASSTENEAVVSTNKVYAAAMNFGAEIIRRARSEIFVRGRSRGGKNEKRKKGQFNGEEKKGQGNTIGEYTITIPARPFMILPESGLKKVIDRGLAWIRERLRSP